MNLITSKGTIDMTRPIRMPRTRLETICLAMMLIAAIVTIVWIFTTPGLSPREQLIRVADANKTGQTVLCFDASDQVVHIDRDQPLYPNMSCELVTYVRP